MNVTTLIHPALTLNEIIAAVPQALPVLTRFGFDTCCGGGLALSVAVERHGLELETVLAALRAAENRA
jgi:regulator of cell morphogenesis and NO signaling